MEINLKEMFGFYGKTVLNTVETSEPLPGVMPPARVPAGTEVTPASALTISSVYRAVSILTTTASQIPVVAWRDGTEIDLIARNGNGWLKRPDVDTHQARFVEQTVSSLALHGNAYWRVFRADASATSQVMNVQVLNPMMVVIETNDQGSVTGYRYGDKTLRKSQVQHLVLQPIPGTPYGLGPIEAAKAELAGVIDLRNYSNNWFKTGGVPTGILSVEGTLTEETLAMHKTAWEASQGGTRGIAVLGGNSSYQPIYMSPDQAQFLESQQFSITRIASMFGIPAFKMLASVEGGSETYANLSQANESFVKDTMMNYFTEMQNAFNDLLPRTQEAKFKYGDFLKADTAARSQSYESALRAGWMTVNEVRALEGLAPLSDGDERPNTETPGDLNE